MKKLFTNDKFFLAMTLCAVLGEAIYAIISLCIMPEFLMANIQLLFRVALVIVLYRSYHRHNKNVMKGMMGCLLTAQVLTGFSFMTLPKLFTGDRAVYFLYLLLSLAMFVIHFIINSDHHSSPTAVRINEVCAILLVLVNTIGTIGVIVHDNSALTVLSYIVDTIGFAGMASVVVCVESRLDAYRTLREANGYKPE